MLKITHNMWFTLPALTLLVSMATPQMTAGQTVIIDGSTPAVGATVERKIGPSVDQLMNRSVVGADGSKIGTVTDMILDDKRGPNTWSSTKAAFWASAARTSSYSRPEHARGLGSVAGVHLFQWQCTAPRRWATKDI